MFNHLSRYFLLSAWAILFAHSIVPHAHELKAELQICASSHEHDADLLDMLGHIFHFSTGVEHLEDYSTGNSGLTLYIPDSTPLLTLPYCAESKSAFFSQKNHFSEAHVHYRPLRAPPIYS